MLASLIGDGLMNLSSVITLLQQSRSTSGFVRRERSVSVRVIGIGFIVAALVIFQTNPRVYTITRTDVTIFPFHIGVRRITPRSHPAMGGWISTMTVIPQVSKGISSNENPIMVGIPFFTL